MELDIAGDFDVLIIDNGSTDGTADLVRQVADRYPGRFSYFVESKIGISSARNAAIQHASGDIIAFTDDDVFFDSGWLKAVYRGFAARQDARCMAGRVIPQYAGGRPAWLGTEPDWLFIEGLYGATRFGDSDRLLTPSDYLVGANMAFRKETFRILGGFNVSMGRQGGSLLSKEETELFERINAAGLKTIYCPEALVIHRIPRERVNKKWILRRFYWQGISAVVLENLHCRQDRASLLNAIKSDLRGIWRVVVGSSLAPRAIYWQLKQLKFWHAVYAAQTIGSLIQRLRYFSKRIPE